MTQQASLTCLHPICVCLGKTFNYSCTYPSFWKHSTNSMFNNSFRNSVLQLGKCLHRHATRSSRVSPIKLLGPLFPRYSNLFCIYLQCPKSNNKEVKTLYSNHTILYASNVYSQLINRNRRKYNPQHS